jgi:hypothetical protein
MSTTDFQAWTKNPELTDDELILLCLKNAPVGCVRKQVMNLIKIYESKLNGTPTKSRPTSII